MICEIINSVATTTSNRKGSLIDRKGGRSKYRFENPNDKIYQVIDFEKDVFGNDTSKCDYGIRTETEMFYIELKGCEVKKGIEQLLTTFSATEKCFKGLNLKARLIVAKFPKPDLVRNTIEYRYLVKKLKHIEGRNNNLIIQTSLSENI